MNNEFTTSELYEIESALIDAIQTYKDFPSRAKSGNGIFEVNFLEIAENALNKTRTIIKERIEKADRL